MSVCFFFSCVVFLSSRYFIPFEHRRVYTSAQSLCRSVYWWPFGLDERLQFEGAKETQLCHTATCIQRARNTRKFANIKKSTNTQELARAFACALKNSKHFFPPVARSLLKRHCGRKLQQINDIRLFFYYIWYAIIAALFAVTQKPIKKLFCDDDVSVAIFCIHRVA